MILSGSTPSGGKVIIHSRGKKKKNLGLKKKQKRGRRECKDTGENSERGYTPEAWNRKQEVEKEN